MDDYDEKRNFYRMTIDCQVHFKIAGENQQYLAQGKNLSSSGILMVTDKELHPGMELEVVVMPVVGSTQPLRVNTKVIRVSKADEGGYLIANSIVAYK